MKKIILSITTIYMLIASATYSLEQAAAGAVRGLMPILEPIAKETLIASIAHAKDVITGATCPVLVPFSCRGPGSSVACLSSHVRSVCKELCQKKIPIEGYKIKVRFGKDWDLVNCVEKGVTTGDTTAEGKANPKEIAVYTQSALDDVLELLAYRKAARRVANVKGAVLEDLKGVSSESANELALKRYSVIQRQNETLQDAKARAVGEAKKLIKDIDQEIAENLANHIYGNQ
jgi:hypothetical protein